MFNTPNIEKELGVFFAFTGKVGDLLTYEYRSINEKKIANHAPIVEFFCKHFPKAVTVQNMTLNSGRLNINKKRLVIH